MPILLAFVFCITFVIIINAQLSPQQAEQLVDKLSDQLLQIISSHQDHTETDNSNRDVGSEKFYESRFLADLHFPFERWPFDMTY